MGLQENLRNARFAVDYVRGKGIRTNSRLEDSRTMSDGEWRDVGQCLADDPAQSVRGQFQAYCQDLWPNQTLPRNWEDVCLKQKPGAMKKKAELAEGKKCGNCNEQDAMAILYLKDTLHVTPLDLMNLQP